MSNPIWISFGDHWFCDDPSARCSFCGGKREGLGPLQKLRAWWSVKQEFLICEGCSEFIAATFDKKRHWDEMERPKVVEHMAERGREDLKRLRAKLETAGGVQSPADRELLGLLRDIDERGGSYTRDEMMRIIELSRGRPRKDREAGPDEAR